jgi:hypothetical protein
MVGTSVWDYVFIRTCIFLLHLVAPISILYSLASSLVHIPFHIPYVLKIWLALETVFYLVVYLPRRAYLQAAVTHPTTACRDDRRRLFWRCHSNIPDPDRYLTKWFRDAPAAEIKRENVKDFFRWAFLNTGEPNPAYYEELEEYAGEMEKLLGRRLEPGRGNAKCLRLTLDKVEMLHRSLTWYLVGFYCEIHVNLSPYLTIQVANFTLFYSVYLLSIQSRPSICIAAPSTSTAHRSSSFLPSSPYAPSLSSLPTTLLREHSLTGTGRTPPRQDSPFSSSTASVSDSTLTSTS